MSIPPSFSQSQPLSTLPRHSAAQIATAASDVSGAPFFNKVSNMLPSVTAEQETLISNFCTLALGVRKIDSTFYETLVSMSQCLIGYEKEMQKLERKVREMQVMLDAFEAVKRFGEVVKVERGGEKKEDGRVEVLVIEETGKEGRVEDVVPEAAGQDGKKKKAEERRGQLVEFKEWPLPPSRTEWVMAQGEKKRKRHTK